MLLLALIGTFTGKTYGRSGGVERTKNPPMYWVMLTLQYLCAVILLSYYKLALAQ